MAKKIPLGRLVPLLVLVLGIAVFFGFGLDEYLGLAQLRRHREWLMAQVEARYLVSLIVFFAIYVAAVALSIPGAAALTIAGGFLFGQVATTALVAVAATLGACILFLAARSAFAEYLRAKAGAWLGRLERGFAENALSYLLVLRLIPLFPFFAVNLAPALLGVPLRTFAIGTFFGIIPGTFVFASLGAGLGSVLDIGDDFAPASALTPEVVTALVGLAVLALLPVAYKLWQRRRGPRK